ncbi:MAG: hypothetical protein Q8M92_05100, partial [Candidatus Subteraquimicrobiales bacterium]|nr:hypothetical protein [Candidatus Subteraquimicrobiales bacterium]
MAQRKKSAGICGICGKQKKMYFYQTMIRSFIAGILLILQGYNAFAFNTEPEYEEISVFMRVQGVGGFEINALYSYQDSRLYLPVSDLFNYLRIYQIPSRNNDTIQGFLIEETRRYMIDYTKYTIQINSETLSFSPNDMLKTPTGLFLHTGVFGKAFGLFCAFHFRSLSVELKTSLELPAIREMRLQLMR